MNDKKTSHPEEDPLANTKRILSRKPAVVLAVLLVITTGGLATVLDLYLKSREIVDSLRKASSFVVMSEFRALSRYRFKDSSRAPEGVFPGGVEVVLRLSTNATSEFPARLTSLLIEHDFSNDVLRPVSMESGVPGGSHKAHVFRVQLQGPNIKKAYWQLRDMKPGEELTPSDPQDLLSIPEELFVTREEPETLRGRIIARVPGEYRVSLVLKYQVGSDELLARFGPIVIQR